MLDGAASRYVGNVSVPANQKMPKKGALVEVRYLYCFPEGCLFQPVYLGVRDDPDFVSSLVPIRDGMITALKVK